MLELTSTYDYLLLLKMYWLTFVNIVSGVVPKFSSMEILTKNSRKTALVFPVRLFESKSNLNTKFKQFPINC